ncbi:Rh156.2 [macacine betaherpesvirus 3]|nr:Rh156.2 [macacine betaherpesvirus 3]
MRERLSIYCICLYLVAQATFILSSSASPTGTSSLSSSTTKGSGTEPLTSSATKLITAQPGSAVAVVLAAQYKVESGSSSSVILPTVLAASGMVVLVILLIGLNLSSTFWSQQVDEESELEEGPSRLHTDTTFISASTVDLCA